MRQPIHRHRLLFAIILMEGYAVLAAELLAIRLLIPHVGSGVEVVAIIISAVLLPLAAGYYVGGQRYQQQARSARRQSVRQLLQQNLLTATLVLVFGLSYVALELVFGVWVRLGIHPLIQVALYGAVFLVYPVFLLAQTVPLVSHYFSHQHLSLMTGRMLFFSTLGSFLGSIVSTLVLMNSIGVHGTAVVVIGVLVLAIATLSRRTLSFKVMVGAGLLLLMITLNHQSLFQRLHIVEQNAYNTVAIQPSEDRTAIEMWLNHSLSSKFSSDPAQRYPYIQAIEQAVLEPLQRAKDAREILVLGAGGFTLGWDDRRHHYTFVDIDSSLKPLAEKHLLPEPLPTNKRFVAQSARSYLVSTNETYDVIVVDLFSNRDAIPLEATTVEFWQQVRAHTKPRGVVVANIIMSASFRDRFSQRIGNTFSAVFPHHLRQVPHGFSIWDDGQTASNVLFISRLAGEQADREIYSDDLSTHSLDRHRR